MKAEENRKTTENIPANPLIWRRAPTTTRTWDPRLRRPALARAIADNQVVSRQDAGVNEHCGHSNGGPATQTAFLAGQTGRKPEGAAGVRR